MSENGEEQKPSNVISIEDQIKKVAQKKEEKRLKDLIDDEVDIGGSSIIDAILDGGEEQLTKMNEKHAFINSFGGSPMVLCKIYSVVANRDIIEFRSPDAIKTQYSNESIKLGNGYIELGKWWIRHKNRREYETIIFDPTKPKIYNNCLNMWEGLTITPTKGSWYYTKRHIWRILCNKNKEKFKYVMKWFAWMVQNPGDRSEVAIIFKGLQGAGKGFIFTQFVKIYGEHGLSISNRKHLTGQFNGHLRNIVFLFADEAYYPGDKEIEGTLKQIITEPYIPIEDKYKSLAPAKNCLHIAMSTNADWVIPAGEDTRRYFINKVDNSMAMNQDTEYNRKKYFSNLWDEMDNGGREAMVFSLQQINLTNWHPRYNIPQTEEMQYQKTLSLAKKFKILLSLLEEGIFPGQLTIDQEYLVASKELFECFEKIDINVKKMTHNARTEGIRKLGCKKEHRRNGNFWLFPDLKTCRLRWDKIYGEHRWENIEDTWMIEKDF